MNSFPPHPVQQTQLDEDKKLLIEGIVRRAANPNSSPQKDAVRKATEILLDQITADLIKDSVIEEAQETIDRLKNVLREANEAFLSIEEVENISDRGKEVVNITAALVRAFVEEATGTGTISRKKSKSVWGSDHRVSVEPTVSREAIRATSYVLWAYLTTGEPFPENKS